MAPPSSSEFPGSRSPDRLKAFAGLLGDVSMLMGELEDTQEAQRADGTYTFEVFGDHQIILPPQVRTLLPDVDQVVVTIGKDTDPSSDEPIPPYLSINFHSRNAAIQVSRSTDLTDVNEPDAFIDLSSKVEDTEVPFFPLAAHARMNSENNEAFSYRHIEIDKMSQKDINTLLMSLIYPDTERGYSMFENIDLLRPDTFESMVESFKFAALGNQSSMMHEFSTSSARFDFNKQEGQPVSFSVYYNETNNGKLGTARPMVAFSNLETDFRLEFRTYEVREEQLEGITRNGKKVSLGSIKSEGLQPYYPTTEDLQALRTILINEIRAMNPATVPLFEDTLIGGIDPDQEFEKSGKADTILSPSHIQNILNKLGFDAPDSGTA